MVEPCICLAYFRRIIGNCNRRVRHVSFGRVGEYCSRGGDEEDAAANLAGVGILGCAAALLHVRVASTAKRLQVHAPIVRMEERGLIRG
jgi:hypothetical protein